MKTSALESLFDKISSLRTCFIMAFERDEYHELSFAKQTAQLLHHGNTCFSWNLVVCFETDQHLQIDTGLGLGLKFIFHWNCQVLILCKSSLRSFAEALISSTTEKRDAFSGSSLKKEVNLSSKSFTEIKNSRGPRTDP